MPFSQLARVAAGMPTGSSFTVDREGLTGAHFALYGSRLCLSEKFAAVCIEISNANGLILWNGPRPDGARWNAGDYMQLCPYNVDREQLHLRRRFLLSYGGNHRPDVDFTVKTRWAHTSGAWGEWTTARGHSVSRMDRLIFCLTACLS